MLRKGEYYRHTKGMVYQIMSIELVPGSLETYEIEAILIEDSHKWYITYLPGDSIQLYATDVIMEADFKHLPAYNSQLFKAVNNA